MIKLEKTEVVGWEAAIRGMRNPKNSWDRSDTVFPDDSGAAALDRCVDCEDDCTLDEIYECCIGPNDHKLMMDLASGGPVHAKYRRMITVYVDITAPLYWWKEFDTYKVGTVANSCSTMHKIHDKEFTLDDFSHEHLIDGDGDEYDHSTFWLNELRAVVGKLNFAREKYLEVDKKLKDINPLFEFGKLQAERKKYWWQMIQLLPSSYNQKRTIMLNYEVLAGIYPMRKNHKLDEWHVFCDWIESLPYSEIIIGTDQAFQYDEEEVAKFVTKVLEKDPNAFDRVYPVSAKELREALARSEKKEE